MSFIKTKFKFLIFPNFFSKIDEHEQSNKNNLILK